jgi:hypothetical protein
MWVAPDLHSNGMWLQPATVTGLVHSDSGVRLKACQRSVSLFSYTSSIPPFSNTRKFHANVAATRILLNKNATHAQKTNRFE